MSTTTKKAKEFSIDSLVSKESSPPPAVPVTTMESRRYLPKPEAHVAAPHPNGLFPSPVSTAAQPHPAFMGAGTTLTSGQNPMVLPPIHGLLPSGASALPGGFPPMSPTEARPSPLLHPGMMAGHPHPAMFTNGIPNPALANKDNFPFYTWLLARHSSYLNHGFPGMLEIL